MNTQTEQPITLFGAGPDTGNQGVTALCYSVLDGLEKRDFDRLTVYDHGQGRRVSHIELDKRNLAFDRLGAINGRRYYRTENMKHMRIAARAGGLWSDSARTVCRARAVLDVSGGDSFTELYGPVRFKTVTLPKLMALDAGRPLILLPQTYGPFRSETAYATAQKIVRQAAAAWARDEASFDQLKALLGNTFDPARHRLGVDMAFGLPSSSPHNDKLPGPVKAWISEGTETQPLIGFNVSGLLYNDSAGAQSQFGLQTDYRTAILQTIRSLLETTNVRIMLVPHVVVGRPDSECDLVACNTLANELGFNSDRVNVLSGSYDAAELKWIIGHTDWFCGTRMHSTIAGLSSEVPTMALAYSMKTAGVFETCGQQQQVVDLRTCDASELSKRVNESWQARAIISRSLAAALPHVQTQASRQMDDIASAIRQFSR